MDGPAYRRRANDRGDFSSPGRGHNQSMSLAGSQARFKESVWKLGSQRDYDPATDLPNLAESIQSQFFRDKNLVLSTFRVAITELPHKLPHFAALIAHLSLTAVGAPAPTLESRIAPAPRLDLPTRPLPARPAGLPSKPVDTEEIPAEQDVEMKADDSINKDEKINVGKMLVADLIKAFQVYLDERKWRNVRYCVLLFAHLTQIPTPTPLVSPSSLITLLSSFTSVLDEPGLRAARGDECVRIVVEALLHLDRATEGTEGLRDSVQSYLAARRLDKELFADAETAGQYEDHLEILISTLTSESTTGPSVLPNIFTSLIPLAVPDVEEDGVPASGNEPISLPNVLVPPELEESDLIKVAPPAASSSGLRGDEGVGYEGVRVYLKLFDDESVPGPYDPSGTILRSLIHDIIDLYEINRKEAAGILLELPNWVAPGTFKPKQSDESSEAEAQSEWVLENMIVESILTSLFSLPKPHLPSAYYHSLLTELCRLSPGTVAPALGKCVRRLYAGLGSDSDGGNPVLDPEGIRRFAEWFSVHLSNFGFMWGWADWAPDMDVSAKHPKRVFVKRTMELEIRLSYYDRVKGTIPVVMLDTGVIPDDAPGAEYAYENPDHKHAAAAASLLRLVRAKGPIPEVETELAEFASALQKEHSLTEEEAEPIKRDMAIQTILSVGSRSFSHFLNVLERYLPLLRTLSPSPATRIELLSILATFWRRNSQFHLIVLDKLLQYRLVDSADVIAWVFSPVANVEEDGKKKKGWSDIDTFTALNATIQTVQGRVTGAKGRLDGITREEEAKAAEKEHEIDLDRIPVDDENREIALAKEQLETVEGELAVTIIEVIRQFSILLPVGVDKDDWETWWVEGWFREFCRSIVGTKILVNPAVVEGIAKLELPKEAPVVAILDSAKSWVDFA
ncbi:MIF4G like-domain-containing protein [Leucosporidium creatinivorum]|uniref:MIF4G like-domain-containing protein n=1 Tax=Leucosporidium creatinivorum TaxID=106004 RepID=A0A1Y2G2Z9_9BASI|nr:MIF4G like-domain-containing protein [Leucosporidium creatinivorum]